MADDPGRPVIVAGVDGSQASRDALRWAARHAALTGGELRVVTAWHLPEIYACTVRDYTADARAALEKTIQGTPRPGPADPAGAQVVEGHPAEVLTRASRDASLLVVGSHGRGALEGMLPGSVSQHCVHHAGCPVVVIRHRSPASVPRTGS